MPPSLPPPRAGGFVGIVRSRRTRGPFPGRTSPSTRRDAERRPQRLEPDRILDRRLIGETPGLTVDRLRGLATAESIGNAEDEAGGRWGAVPDFFAAVLPDDGLLG